MEQRIKYGTILLFTLIIGLLIYGYLNHISRKSPVILNRDRPHVAAKDLISIAGNNEALFNKKYLYKIISVKGAIQDTYIAETGTYAVRLGADSSQPGLSVNCILDSMYNRRQPGFHPGDSCTIQGTCAGQLGNIIMVDCIIEY